jgi:hypothetical protein
MLAARESISMTNWRRSSPRRKRRALHLFDEANAPRTTVTAPFSWMEDGALWRPRYGRVDPSNLDRLRAIGDERRRQQAKKKAVRIAQAISDRAAG